MLEMLIHFQNCNVSLPKYRFVDLCGRTYGQFYMVLYEYETYLDEEHELQMLEDIFLGSMGALYCAAYRGTSQLVHSMPEKSGDYNSGSLKPEVMYAYSRRHNSDYS